MPDRNDTSPAITAFQREVNRRDFLCAATGVAAAALLLPFGAAAQPVPKRGGTLRIGLPGAASGDSLDPGTFNEVFMYAVGWALRNNLTEIAPSGEIIGELAESWEPSSGLTTWHFKLRQGVEFHNGKTMTADDVVASLNHHRGKDSKSRARAVLANVDDMRADGKHTVVFHLKERNAELPGILSNFPLPIMPATPSGGADWASGVGTGGYKLKNFVPGVRTSVERNGNYWKKGRAHFDAIELLAINDVAARTSALQSGAIDVMQRCDTKTASLIARMPSLRLIELPSQKCFITPMRTDREPFNNADVRAALKYAVNRQALVDTTLNGHGAVGNDQPLGPTYQYHASDIPQRAYDIDKAKFHMKRAGYDKLKLTLHTSAAAYPGAIDAAVLLKEQALPAGIEVEVKQEPADGYWSNIWRKESWCVSWFGGRATDGTALAEIYSRGSFSNASYWYNEKFDRLLSEVLGTIDTAKRRELFREMELIIRDDGGDLIFAFPNILDAHSEKVQHGKVSSKYELDGYRATERWWFA